VVIDDPDHNDPNEATTKIAREYTFNDLGSTLAAASSGIGTTINPDSYLSR